MRLTEPWGFGSSPNVRTLAKAADLLSHPPQPLAVVTSSPAIAAPITHYPCPIPPHAVAIAPEIWHCGEWTVPKG